MKGKENTLQRSVLSPYPWAEACLVFTSKPSPSVSFELTIVLCSGLTAVLRKASVSMRRGAESGQRITACTGGAVHHCFLLRLGEASPLLSPDTCSQAVTQHLAEACGAAWPRSSDSLAGESRH